MKSVLISIRPEWCRLIASGEKTVEVRKTKPKLETPFKVYIYCTKDEPTYRSSERFWCPNDEWGNGKVIGEFVCDDIAKIRNLVGRFIAEGRSERETETIARASCLVYPDMKRYLGKNDGYAWHISDLRRIGVPIISETEKVKNRFGEKCYIKRYMVREEA
jgi:hypothetical protein